MFFKNFVRDMINRKERKELDLEKISLRASLKDLMKMRGLRSINISNYRRYLGDKNPNSYWLHSLKLDPVSGYLNMFSPRGNDDIRAGEKIEGTTLSQYREANQIVQDILRNESDIPFKVKRNILVGISR